jgi:FAD:protein FMN transferase
MQHHSGASAAADNPAVGSLRHVASFPEALGTGIVMHTESALDTQVLSDIGTMIEAYEQVLSRFRDDSLVQQMSKAEHGGSFDFPDYLNPLFEIVDLLFAATQGSIDPLVGADLVKLGYGPDLSFHPRPDVRESLGWVHGRARWNEAVTRHGTTLITRQAVQCDFGAVGKGFLVDLLSERCAEHSEHLLIDAGGDLNIRAATPVSIALEDPSDDEDAVGVAEILNGSLCASAPSRRRWTAELEGQGTGKQPDEQHLGHETGLVTLHHLLNAIDGMPVEDVMATWVTSPNPSGTTPLDVHDFGNFPTAVADGLSTALFVCDPDTLSRSFPFECAVIRNDRTALVSRHFPGSLFIR